ncbi:MAG: hypothetical protein KGK33_06360 [Hyphomicrobiales bacterium]|nr:hypothetical protein [Hyphomicrobiales bacterium]MDE1972661.1 hypothetical protein [Hyphomicrobiales bacterium]MDE2284220.1 hypothetical protein [Hyphomicrobiales bacterium]MDE2373555.1 hypothetical protein [Hyphomicrobiales bacterium]
MAQPAAISSVNADTADDRYEPAELSDEMFMLLMRINESGRRKARAAGRQNAAVSA